MTALAFVTQTVDERDHVLAVVPSLITALAERLDRVTVIANSVARPLPSLPPNVAVESLGKERGAGHVARGLRYERLLVREARAHRLDALLAHMCPAYLNLAVPAAKAFGFPTMLWFAHPARSRALSLSDAAADAVLTSLPGAYPLTSAKVHVIGQATDTRRLSTCAWKGPHRPLRIVAIGRTSPSKGFDVVVRAVAACVAAGTPVKARIIGPSLTAQERRHREELTTLVADLGLKGRVTIEPAMAAEGVRDAICDSDVLVNAMVAGSGDKVVFEAASLGRPVLVSNPAFAGLLSGLSLGLTFPEGGRDALAERLEALAAAPAPTVRQATRTLRERIESDHSLDHWADQVVAIAERVIRARRRR